LKEVSPKKSGGGRRKKEKYDSFLLEKRQGLTVEIILQVGLRIYALVTKGSLEGCTGIVSGLSLSQWKNPFIFKKASFLPGEVCPWFDHFFFGSTIKAYTGARKD